MPTRTGTLARGTGWQELRPPVLLRGKADLTKVCVYGPFQLHNISLGPLGRRGLVHRLQRRLRRL
jgi:hypothetical protein